MPSSKKNRGRERRANKEKKATTALEKCAHGLPVPLPVGHVLWDVMTVFESAFQRFSPSDENGTIASQAIDAIIFDYPKALSDNENRSKMKEMLLAVGTEALLSDERPQRAIMFAESVVRLEHLNNCVHNKSKVEQVTTKGEREIRDLFGDGTRGLIRFFAKRVPCACLDKMNKEAKRQAKKGRCYSCCKFFDFNALLECSCCFIVHYCSKECQKANWDIHKLERKRVSTERERLGL